MDLFRSMAELAGVAGETGLDGLSLAPLLRNPQAPLAREALHFHYPHYYSTTTPVSAVRVGDWKLLEYYEDGRLELFNLREDPGEQHNRAPDQPERALRMQRRLEAWRQAVGAQRPERDEHHP